MICWLKGLWYWWRAGCRTWVSGHDYTEIQAGRVQVLRCDRCGHISVGVHR